MFSLLLFLFLYFCGCQLTLNTQLFTSVLSADNVPITYSLYGPATDPTIVFVHG